MQLKMTISEENGTELPIIDHELWPFMIRYLLEQRIRLIAPLPALKLYLDEKEVPQPDWMREDDPEINSTLEGAR